MASNFARTLLFALNDCIHKCKSHSNLVQNKGQQTSSLILPYINWSDDSVAAAECFHKLKGDFGNLFPSYFR